MPPTTIEITIRRLPDASLAAELRAELPRSRADLGGAPIDLNPEVLRALSTSPDVYGATLSAMVFPAPLKEAWERARGFAERGGAGIHVRVAIDDPSGALHALRWELLRDPRTGAPLAQQEGGSLARLVVVEQLYDTAPPAKPALRALVAVAGPSDAARYGLASVDVTGEAVRALEALGDIQAELLTDAAPGSRGLATRANLRNGLRNSPHILYLVCHGRATAQGTTLFLVGDDGTAAPLSGDQLAEEIAALDVAHRPLLVVLLACEGASQEAEPLAAVGPLLARAGVPAVVAMQTRISIAAAAQLTARLLRELGRDGRIDRALAAARKELGGEWWAPVLWLRSRDGRLWQGEAAENQQRDQKLRAMLHDHSGFIASRMESFVGRTAELAEIRQRIAEKRPTGGYVTITGQAGQGKSSVIARLVADAVQTSGSGKSPLREQLQQPAAGVPVCHFIPFSPGPDHQVGLLRNLIARLCLTYDLPDFYAAADSRPALRDYFAAALRDLAKQGCQEIIYIDGLDQIEEDSSGVRDLSFLPEEPPAGIVFVLGTRPNDTLKPLNLLKERSEYQLPPLSRADFDLILTHRGVKLDALLADRFYATMQENALYLDLVARELTQADAVEPEQIIARVADNPANLFSLSIERLQRNERQWEMVLRPILGLLLATRAPLSQRALRALIGIDDLRTRQGLERLGGLVQRDGEGRYGLFHLKLGEHLRQAVFASDEEEGYHQQLAAWCEGGKGGIDAIWQDVPSDALEQERRAYARQHYIAHLAAARAYERLWSVIDAGAAYGAAKRRYDPSTRSYALDLDIARQSVIDAAVGDVEAQARGLPRLWRYSLLRCSLTSQADNYPEELFLALVALGQSGEAIGLAELLSDPVKKVNRLRVIGAALLERGTGERARLLQRISAAAAAIPPTSDQYAAAFSALVAALASAQCWDKARAAAAAIPAGLYRNAALSALAVALASAQRWDEARVAAAAIPPTSDQYAATLSALTAALASAQRWDEARAAAAAIPPTSDQYAATLSALTAALASAQRWDEARAAAAAIPPTSDQYAATLSALAAALASAQHPLADETFAAARAAAVAIPESWRRTTALGTLAVALASAQYAAANDTFIAARAAADATASSKLLCSVALSTLAAALASAHHSSAAATFVDARATADAIHDDRPRHATALGALAAALVSAQHWSEARNVADAIPRKTNRATALSALATALASAQRWDEARAAADAIPADRFGSHVKALSTLTVALVAAHHPSATVTFVAARAAADAISDEWRRAAALRVLAAALASVHHPATNITSMAARAAADAIPESWHRAAAFTALGTALALSHDPLADATFAAARATADTVSNEWYRAAEDPIPEELRRSGALSTLAAALASAQRWDEARAVADAIPDDGERPERRAVALSSLAAALASAHHPSADETFAAARAAAVAKLLGDKDRAAALSTLAAALTSAQHADAAITFVAARTAADAISDDGRRAEALSRLAAALASAQRWDEARTIASILNAGYRADAFRSLAAALAAAKHAAAPAAFVDARAAADAIPADGQRAFAMSAMAAALATAQRWDDARATAEAIPDDRNRTEAFCALAAALAQAGLLPEATAIRIDLWRRAQTRDELLSLFAIDAAILRAYPELGQAFLDSFAWVDAQLAIG